MSHVLSRCGLRLLFLFTGAGLCALPAMEGRSGLSALELFNPTHEGWKYNGKLGLLGTMTGTGNADTSYDTTIAGSSTSAAVLSTIDVRAVYQVGNDSLEHTVSVRYGQLQDATSSHFTENEDEIRYDGIYRHLMVKPHFIYGLLGADTVATGPHHDDPAAIPDDYGHPFDPLQARVSSGYGQRWEEWLPNDFLEWRIGLRLQHRWGSQGLPGGQDSTAHGPEGYLRYESMPAAMDKRLTYFLQYEAFAEMNDIRHMTNLITGSLALNLAKHLQLQIAVRAYYETRPKEDREAQEFPGYNRWSYKYDNLVGLTYIF